MVKMKLQTLRKTLFLLSGLWLLVPLAWIMMKIGERKENE